MVRLPRRRGPPLSGPTHSPPVGESCQPNSHAGPQGPPQTSTECHMSGTVAAPEGITDPPIDELLAAADSKYALVIYSAKRARQINAYYSQLNEGLLEYVGPLVEARHQEKALSIAMREINAGLLTITPTDG